MRSSLIDTHPRLGLAWWRTQREEDLTGDYPGHRFCEILRHDYGTGRCSRCGNKTQQHTIVTKLLVSPNAGLLSTKHHEDCACGGTLSMTPHLVAPSTYATQHDAT